MAPRRRCCDWARSLPPTPEPSDDEPDRQELRDVLDEQRRAVADALDGLTGAEIRSTPLASAMSVGGIVQHLGYIERWWFTRVFAGDDVEFPWNRAEPDAAFRLSDELTVDQLRTFFVGECKRSDVVIDAAELGDLAARPKYPVTLRWIVLHMIEETARHLGHLDLLRDEVLALRQR